MKQGRQKRQTACSAGKAPKNSKNKEREKNGARQTYIYIYKTDITPDI